MDGAAAAAAAAAADDDADADGDDVLFQWDVNGECETKYVIKSEPSVDYSSVSNMVVTKVKDLNKCLTRNSFEQGVFAGLPHYSSEKVCLHPFSFLLPFYFYF